MRRVLIIGLIIGLCAVVLTACGSSSKSSSKSTKTTTTVESAETRTWSDAAAQGVLASDSSSSEHITAADAACLGHALVDTITVVRLKSAGVTLGLLRDANGDLPAGLSGSLPLTTKQALGAAMQRCGFGRLVGPVFATSFAGSFGHGYRVDAQSKQCMGNTLDAPAQRLLVADLVLSSSSRGPSAADTAGLAKVLQRCLDWGAAFSLELKITPSAAETACMNRLARADARFGSSLAAEISGKPGAEQGFQLLGARLVKCLTPEHILQIGKAGK